MRIERFRVSLQTADLAITRWMARYGIVLLRLSLGIVFLWFGVLKFFPNASPAQELATRTISVLSWGRVPVSVSLPILAYPVCAHAGRAVHHQESGADQRRDRGRGHCPRRADDVEPEGQGDSRTVRVALQAVEVGLHPICESTGGA